MGADNRLVIKIKDLETQKLIDDVLDQHVICYLWNITFKHYYKNAFKLGEAKKLVEDWNQCKGGRWEIHDKGQYDAYMKIREAWHSSLPSLSMPSLFMEESPQFFDLLYSFKPADFFYINHK